MIKDNLQRINYEIKKICPKRQVKIVAVSKNRTKKDILNAVKQGIRIIGENRYQEAEKKGIYDVRVEKHFIGRLQTNKVKGVVKIFDMIQSADSKKLLDKINQECQKINKIMPVLIQVNTSCEPQKGGCHTNETKNLIDYARTLHFLKIKGLMTIGPFSAQKKQTKKCFKKLKKLFEEIRELKILSMGMTDDYQIALEAGSNMIRIGKGIFDK